MNDTQKAPDPAAQALVEALIEVSTNFYVDHPNDKGLALTMALDASGQPVVILPTFPKGIMNHFDTTEMLFRGAMESEGATTLGCVLELNAVDPQHADIFLALAASRGGYYLRDRTLTRDHAGVKRLGEGHGTTMKALVRSPAWRYVLLLHDLLLIDPEMIAGNIATGEAKQPAA